MSDYISRKLLDDLPQILIGELGRPTCNVLSVFKLSILTIIINIYIFSEEMHKL